MIWPKQLRASRGILGVIGVLAAVCAPTGGGDEWAAVDEGARRRAQAAAAADLAFLAGVWRGEAEGSTQEEVWTAPLGGVLLGLNRTVTPGEPTHWEFLRIEEGEEGVVFWASPGGAEPTPFRLVGLDDGTAIFANPDHDFPQRLVYRRSGDRLVVRVEAKREGESAGFELRWRLAGELP